MSRDNSGATRETPDGGAPAMAGEFTEIRFEKHGHVAEIALDRADKLNAFSTKFFYEIENAFEQIEADDEIRAVLLYAEGRIFTAGLDLKEVDPDIFGAGSGSNGAARSAATKNFKLYKTIKRLQKCFTAIEECSKPTVAAVHGKCVGGGVDLTTACDIRVCSADASFSIFETKIAIVADVGTLQRITPIVGKGMAREMAYTGRFIDAERSLACGLVNQVLSDREAAIDAARTLTEEIAANSPLAVQGTKIVLNYSDEHSVEEGLEFVAQWNSSFLQSNDIAEAMSAFVEKRAPVFKGD
jgi:enoyl-CoA hydratase/carnithine racemase